MFKKNNGLYGILGGIFLFSFKSFASLQEGPTFPLEEHHESCSLLMAGKKTLKRPLEESNFINIAKKQQDFPSEQRRTLKIKINQKIENNKNNFKAQDCPTISNKHIPHKRRKRGSVSHRSENASSHPFSNQENTSTMHKQFSLLNPVNAVLPSFELPNLHSENKKSFKDQETLSKFLIWNSRFSIKILKENDGVPLTEETLYNQQRYHNINTAFPKNPLGNESF